MSQYCPNDHQLERKKKQTNNHLSILKQLLALQLAEIIGLTIKAHWLAQPLQGILPQ